MCTDLHISTRNKGIQEVDEGRRNPETSTVYVGTGSKTKSDLHN